MCIRDRTRVARWAVSEFANISWTTRNSSLSRRELNRPCSIQECEGLVPISQRPRIVPDSISPTMRSYGQESCEGICSGPAQIAAHERQIDDSLRRPGCLMALVNPHSPPKGDAFSAVDEISQFPK